MKLMSLIIFIAFLANFSICLASPASGKWEKFNEYKEKAQGIDGFEQLKEEYPKAFGNKYEGKYVDTASVTTTVYKFVGKHSCPDEDSRLIREEQNFGTICYFPEDGGSKICGGFGKGRSSRSTKDPCYQPAQQKSTK